MAADPRPTIPFNMLSEDLRKYVLDYAKATKEEKAKKLAAIFNKETRRKLGRRAQMEAMRSTRIDTPRLEVAGDDPAQGRPDLRAAEEPREGRGFFGTLENAPPSVKIKPKRIVYTTLLKKGI